MIQIKKIQIPELPTKESRRLYIYLPHGYERSDQRYPVLYMFDGHNVFFDSHATYGKSWGMKDYMKRAKLPLIIAAIECNHEGQKRLDEYAPWDTKSARFGRIHGRGKITMDWMTGWLKPFIDSKYRTLPERETTLIAGSSMGGLMSIYAAAAYNDVFSRAAALSPSIWAGGKKLHTLLTTTELRSPTHIYMDLGTEEIPADQRNHLAELFETAADLTRSGADVSASLIPGAAHCEAAWEQRIPIFMDYLLNDII